MFSVPEGVKTEVTPGGVRRADGVVTTPRVQGADLCYSYELGIPTAYM